MMYSIITVTFNDVDGLRRTLDSITAQSCSDYEVIIIDGASTCKESVSLLNSLEKMDRVRVYSETDRGIYDAMNKGLSHIRGDYFIFMNSGDTFYSDNVLDNVVEHISDSVPLFFGQARISALDSDEFSLYPKSGVNIENWLIRSLPNHQAMFFKSDVFRDLKFREDLRVSADSVFKLAALDYKWKYSEIIICNFYLGGLSSSNSIKSIFYQFSDRLKRTDRFGGFLNSLVFLSKKIVQVIISKCFTP